MTETNVLCPTWGEHGAFHLNVQAVRSLVLGSLLLCLLLIPPTPAEAVIRYCCPTGIAGHFWQYEAPGWTAYSGPITVANLHNGQYNTYELLLINKYPWQWTKPCGNDPECGPEVAHNGNTLCNQPPQCWGGRKADCNPLRKQVLAQLCNHSSFDKNSSSHV